MTSRGLAAEAPIELANAVDREGEIEGLIRSLHERRGQDLYGLAISLGLPHEDASDAVQEAMLRLWRQLLAGVDLRDLDAWAFRATYNLAMDHHRLRRRVTSMLSKLIDGSPRDDDRTANPDASVENAAVWAVVDGLPPRQRAVLYLRYRADMPFEQIGRVLGISANAARSHSSFALATLRRRLAQEDR